MMVGFCSWVYQVATCLDVGIMQNPLHTAHSECKKNHNESSIRVQYRPLSWTHLEPHSEAVEQFLAMLRFEQKNQVKKLSEVLK